MVADNQPQSTLTLTCPDTLGIVSSVAGFFSQNRCNIVESAQFGDPKTNRFFMRVSIDRPPEKTLGDLREEFAEVAAPFFMKYQLHDKDTAVKTLILVSKSDYCLRDLIYRRDQGELNIDLTRIVSNHEDCAAVADAANIPFHYLPIDPSVKAEQEKAIVDLISKSGSELVVLARYMQILSPEFCAQFPERIINIHHSFLPGFKGARPYQQAHARGVKLIGATAHYATPDLDEGPIIDQETPAYHTEIRSAILFGLGAISNASSLPARCDLSCSAACF
jgi:formyltetrahydrofolate deformylase